jgi:short-subunit dehydrogenase
MILIIAARIRKWQQREIKRIFKLLLQMVRAFLPPMIERRRGRIVSISSVTAHNPLPFSVAYSATKWGLHGFMTCLRRELLSNDQEFIKLTTIFPDFINTRKELSDVLDLIGLRTPRESPEYVADEAVKGVLNNMTDVIVSRVKAGVFVSK